MGRRDGYNVVGIKKYSEPYYASRRLYFQALKTPPNKFSHTYSSNQIRNIVAEQFNVSIPASTIRRWSISPDKDFNGLSWAEEWDRRMAIGRRNLGEQLLLSEQLTEQENTLNDQEVTEKSPVEMLSALRKQSILNDAEIVAEGNVLIQALIREVEEEYKKTGRVNRKMLKSLYPFHFAAKAQLSEELSHLKDMEEHRDVKEKYGRYVTLKDPQARERVRQAIIGIINIALEKSGYHALGDTGAG